MSTGRNINKICIAAVIVSLVLTLLLINVASFGNASAGRSMGYENRLFDTSVVHTLDIVMDDWDGFIETCESEEYSPCAAVIDGESFKNIGIRAKGNTSLSSVRSMGSQRYSFKLEFDQYETGKTYHGLDKLSLNNLIQDNTLMKDYLVYQMMEDFGADAPLCSYVYITVNDEDWGLYLAVEGVEDSFLQRNYGPDGGELYKPDSMSFGGGRGNGRDFNFDGLNMQQPQEKSADFPEAAAEAPETAEKSPAEALQGRPERALKGPENFGGGAGGMGSDDVKLKYIDDDPDSYSNIFDQAKTDVTDADRQRLIGAIKNLNEYTDLTHTLDMDEVLRYFVVHNFVCNGDSYTGAMIHNYYLHEQDGQLSMIPWDYNLAFGTFQGSSADSSVNASIDSPVSGGDVDDRPMLGWIFSDEAYTQEYHRLFSDFINRWFSDGQLAQMIGETKALLEPYVEKDPTKFCTEEEFDAGVQALETFTALRAEAVSRQLGGDASPVDTAGLNLSDMGTMGGKNGRNPASGDRDPDTGDFRPDFGNMPRLDSGDAALASGAQAGQGENVRPVSPANAGMELGISVGVLLLGLLFAGIYKRK